MLRKKSHPLSDESMNIYNKMIPKSSILREIKKYIDFNFIYEEVKNFYDPYLGRPSEDPIRLVKAELLKVMFNLRGDDELLAEISDRASFREFLDINLDEALWDRSTLVKFRKKLGSKTTDKLLSKVIDLCAKHKLIDGNHEVIDGTNVKARARILGNRDNIYVDSSNIDSKKKQI
ncbi:transposase [Clostridium sp. PL3]|uniref:Transposase n=1 Tax=Clostridium thailandense TaxID=2794346 RepID=A0A949X5F6_9CLOT|nr:transposase [Clostridium thailandense]MBV7275568.1 transposase [Clostridium thailandense]